MKRAMVFWLVERLCEILNFAFEKKRNLTASFGQNEYRIEEEVKMENVVNCVSMERWPWARDNFFLSKKGSFIVSFGITDCSLSKKTLDILKDVAQLVEEKIYLFYFFSTVEDQESYCEKIKTELKKDIENFPIITIFKDGDLKKVIVPDKNISSEDIINVLR